MFYAYNFCEIFPKPLIMDFVLWTRKIFWRILRYLHTYVMLRFLDFTDPVTPRSDQHLISPYNITRESHNRVTRIMEMITN